MVVFDASDPDGQDSSRVSIPGIDRLLIIGSSPALLNFTRMVSEAIHFEKMHKSTTVDSAVNILKSIKFSVVIVDGDDAFDVVSCTRLISLHNSAARIVLVSENLKRKEVYRMNNNGTIHGFIALPSEPMLVHTILAQEQASYHINQTLNMLIADPDSKELFSPANYQRSRRRKLYRLVTVSVVHNTVSRFSMVTDPSFEMDPVLYSSYFSALSIMSEQFIALSGSAETFEFRDKVVFMKTIDGVQYIFTFSNFDEHFREEITQLVGSVSQQLYLAFGSQFKIESPLDDQHLERLVSQNLPANQREDPIELANKVRIINIKEPNETLSQFYDETERVYEVQYVDTEEQLFDLINDKPIDLVIFNGFEEEFKWNKYLLNIVKDESPFTQSIAVLRDRSLDISAVLNVNDLDLVVDSNTELDHYYYLVKRAAERSKSIQSGMVPDDPSKVYRFRNRPELVRAMLRSTEKHQISDVRPVFHSLIIMIDGEKFYSYYDEEEVIYETDEELFFGFISSLLTFSDELRNSPLAFSGIKYGSSNIIVKEIYEYHFIFFVNNLNQANYDLVSKVLSNATREVYEVVMYDVNPHVLSEGLDQVLDEICSQFNERMTAEDTS